MVNAMKGRVRLVRILMYLTSTTATWALVAVGIVLVAIFTERSIVASTILAPARTLYIVTTRAVIVKGFFAPVTVERVILPATFAP
jgi:hypothetical protein